jgi:hypothetical protein
LDNRRWIEAATNRRCSMIAYPLGDYDESILGLCRELDFDDGFAVERRPKGPRTMWRVRSRLRGSAFTDHR